MRKIAVILVFVSCIGLSGCQWSERRKSSMEFNVLSSAFSQKTESGQTTREQEQAYIKAVASLALQLDRSIRGTKSAQKTREQAEIFGKTGIDPTKPINIDSNRSRIRPN
jgi:hypothetical protein